MEEKRIINLVPKIVFAICLLLFIIAICPIDLQNDTFYDILLGKIYSQSGVYTIDNFSVHQGLVYQSHHFLVDVIIYNIYNIFSYIGLHVFEIILTCVIAVLFYILNNKFTNNKKIAYLVTFVEIIMFSMFISLRAQMFSTIIFLTELILINKYLYEKISKKIENIILVVLTLLPVLLINLHSGVIFFYYIILAVYALNLFKVKLIRIENDVNIDKSKLKKIIILSVISIPLLLLNPYGINGITYMFKTLSNSFINQYIQEFQPYSVKGLMGMYMTIYFGVHIASLILSNRKIKLHELLLFIGTMFMALLSIRHFIFYIITTVVLLPHLEFVIFKFRDWLYTGLNEKGPKAMKFTIYLVVILIISTITVKKLSDKAYSYIPSNSYPISAVEYIKNNIGYDKVIFNEYSWGSYMMLNNIKVFIDSRCDLYTKEYNKGVTIAEDYMKTTNCKVHYEDMVKKYNIQYFFIKKDEALTTMLLKDSNYEVVYKDNISYIFKRK